MVVAYRCFLDIDLVNYVIDTVYCDAIEVDLVDILLGRPCLYYHDAVHCA